MDVIPPDPYAALNVPRDATSAAIKTAYRKLALKFHPDKAKDKGEEFHRIQQAYELIGEDESRRKHDDQMRLSDLRKDVYARRGSHGPTVEVRTAGFDMRSGSSPGGAFQARGPPRYEERRPTGAPAGGSAARSPYMEDEGFDSYFPSRSGSRKYGGYDDSPRRAPPAKATPPKTAPRSEETREAMRKEKVNSSKSRNEKKKQRDQEMGRERKGKYETSFVSVESDGSDDEYFAPPNRREPQFIPERLRKENRADFYDDTHRSEKFQSQSSNIRDYINRAKVEGGPQERGSPPPPPSFQRSSSAQEPPTFAREAPQAPQRDGQFEVRRGGRELRPAMVRKAASKPKDKSPDSPKSSKVSAKETRSRPVDRRSPEPLHTTDERRPPTLQTTSSAPNSIRIPKSRTMDELDPKINSQQRGERSATMPGIPPTLRRSSTRRGDTTPIVSSGLRHAETNDSGYSTSNSPSETPQPPSTKYYYGAEPAHVENNTQEYESVLREPSRMYRRSPSPVPEALPRERERPSSMREKPVLSRTASYQAAAQPRHNSVDLDRDRPTAVPRRPSMPRRTSSSTRPSSSNRTPPLQRGTSSPIPTPPLRTGGLPSSKDPLFGEILSDSPIEWREPNYSGSSGGSSRVRRMPEDVEVQFGRRYVPEDVSYGSYAHGGSGRRGSEDLARARAEASAYMESRERPGPQLKRSGTYAY